VLTVEVPTVVPDEVDLEEPGPFVVQSAHVRIGICDFSSDPGRVRDRPRPVVSSARSAARRRSMVAADIDTSAAARSSLMCSSPWRRSDATSSGSIGARRFPVGPSRTAHALRSASTTSGP
jgi:hypothetical protein